MATSFCLKPGRPRYIKRCITDFSPLPAGHETSFANDNNNNNNEKTSSDIFPRDTIPSYDAHNYRILPPPQESPLHQINGLPVTGDRKFIGNALDVNGEKRERLFDPNYHSLTSSFYNSGTTLIPSVTSAFRRVPQRVDASQRDRREVPASQRKTCDDSPRYTTHQVSPFDICELQHNKNAIRYKSLDDFLHLNQSSSEGTKTLVTKLGAVSPSSSQQTGRLSATFENRYKSWTRTSSKPRQPTDTKSDDIFARKLQRCSAELTNPRKDNDVVMDRSPDNTFRLLSPDACSVEGTYSRLASSSSPCKLLMDIVRESHLQAFPHSPTNIKQTTPAHRLHDEMSNLLTSPSAMISSHTLTSTTSIKLKQTSDKTRSQENYQLDYCPSTRSNTLLIIQKSPDVKHGNPLQAYLGGESKITPSLAVNVKSPEINKPDYRNFEVDRRNKTNLVNCDELRPKRGNEKFVENVSELHMNVCYNTVTDKLDSVIAQLTTAFDSLPKEDQPRAELLSATAAVTERQTQTIESADRDSPFADNYEVGKMIQQRSSESSGSNSSLHRTESTDRNHVRNTRLAAELKTIQRRRVLYQISREDSPVAQLALLPLPKQSVIKRYRDRQRQQRRASSSESSSTSSSSLASSLSECSSASKSAESCSFDSIGKKVRNAVNAERKFHKREISRDISPVADCNAIELLNWHTVANIVD